MYPAAGKKNCCGFLIKQKIFELNLLSIDKTSIPEFSYSTDI
jgi:hypothetical protein